jgi:hypothetical protein
MTSTMPEIKATALPAEPTAISGAAGTGVAIATAVAPTTINMTPRTFCIWILLERFFKRWCSNLGLVLYPVQSHCHRLIAVNKRDYGYLNLHVAIFCMRIGEKEKFLSTLKSIR